MNDALLAAVLSTPLFRQPLLMIHPNATETMLRHVSDAEAMRRSLHDTTAAPQVAPEAAPDAANPGERTPGTRRPTSQPAH
jgi:hypothetical protein